MVGFTTKMLKSHLKVWSVLEIFLFGNNIQVGEKQFNGYYEIKTSKDEWNPITRDT